MAVRRIAAFFQPDPQGPNSGGTYTGRGTVNENEEQALRGIAEFHRRLIQGRARIERQRAIVARLEQLRIDTAKQQTLLARMLEAQDEDAQRATELLDWLQANRAPHARPLVAPPH